MVNIKEYLAAMIFPSGIGEPKTEQEETENWTYIHQSGQHNSIVMVMLLFSCWIGKVAKFC